MFEVRKACKTPHSRFIHLSFDDHTPITECYIKYKNLEFCKYTGQAICKKCIKRFWLDWHHDTRSENWFAFAIGDVVIL